VIYGGDRKEPMRRPSPLNQAPCGPADLGNNDQALSSAFIGLLAAAAAQGGRPSAQPS